MDAVVGHEPDGLSADVADHYRDMLRAQARELAVRPRAAAKELPLRLYSTMVGISFAAMSNLRKFIVEREREGS